MGDVPELTTPWGFTAESDVPLSTDIGLQDLPLLLCVMEKQACRRERLYFTLMPQKEGQQQQKFFIT